MNGKSKWNHTGTQDRTGDLQRVRLTSQPLDHTRIENLAEKTSILIFHCEHIVLDATLAGVMSATGGVLAHQAIAVQLHVTKESMAGVTSAAGGAFAHQAIAVSFKPKTNKIAALLRARTCDWMKGSLLSKFGFVFCVCILSANTPGLYS